MPSLAVQFIPNAFPLTFTLIASHTADKPIVVTCMQVRRHS